MVDKGKYAILTDAVMLLRTDITYGPRLSNCWLPASTWAEALGRFDVINASLGVIDVRRFNTGMSKSASFGESMHRFDGSNTTGVFRVTYKNTFYYYFTEKSRQIRYPCPLNSAWNEKVMEAAANVLVIPSTRSRPALDTMITTLVDTEATTGGRIGDIVEQSPSKRARIGDTGAAAAMIAADASSSSYWPCSPEAYRVFKPPKKHGTTNCEDGNDTDFDSETPMEALQRRIVLLQSVHEEENNWRNVVQGRDIDNVCTKAEILCAVRQRATFLCYAYRLALAKMNEWTWQDCCTESCKVLNTVGMTQATFYKTIANWNIVLRNFECFPNPNLSVQCGKRPLPRVLEVFPCAKEQIVAFGVENLSHLSIEAVYQFVHSSVIPRLAALWKRESVVDEDTAETSTLSTSTTAINPTSNPVDVDQDEDDIALFLRAHRLKNMSFTTAWRWMRLLGFKYDTRRKSFYVDGHEREDVVAHRNAFCKNYLTVLEPRCRRWIQLPLSEAATIKTLDTDFGHHYYDIISDETRVEFHVDYWKNCISRIKRGEEAARDVEAKTSIRVSSSVRPLMIIGQDESVFAQYLLSSKQWVGPKGQVPLLPKSEGDGYMLSAFVSREFGFGRQMTEDELQRVNMARQTAALGGGNYLDTTAAMEILGTTRKPILLESPFVKYLFIGINNQGYWNSYHMSLQLEDVVDCLRILYPSFDFVFLFDHSQGHARKRDGALSAINMQKNFGGSKQQMRDTVIMSQEGYLGTHSPTLGIGDTQSMVFNTDDCGPWYLTPEQRDLQRHDRIMGKRSKPIEKTKKTLLEELNEKGVMLQQKRGYTKAELQELARNNSIETHKEVDKILSGWEGKSKGMLQVLWERGLIDPSELDKYTVDGKKDTISGKIDLRYSLRHLIAECADFKDEETGLQYLGSQLGITVLLTPKFHAELAGEGIEFCWGHAKAFYRRVPVSQKRGRENFKQLVRDSTCSIKELTKERMGKFASRARAYICTYHHLFESQQRMKQQGRTHNFIATSITEDQGLLYSEIQRLMKLFKSHRCALDFDRGFVNSALKEAKTRNEEDVV